MAVFFRLAAIMVYSNLPRSMYAFPLVAAMAALLLCVKLPFCFSVCPRRLVTPDCPPLKLNTAGRNGLALLLRGCIVQKQVQRAARQSLNV